MGASENMNLVPVKRGDFTTGVHLKVTEINFRVTYFRESERINDKHEHKHFLLLIRYRKSFI